MHDGDPWGEKVFHDCSFKDAALTRLNQGHAERIKTLSDGKNHSVQKVLAARATPSQKEEEWVSKLLERRSKCHASTSCP